MPARPAARIVLALMALSPAVVHVIAQSTSPAPQFAPARTLPRDEQIAIALSAAPDSVAQAASVWVQKPSGTYELARQGTNGFGCLIQTDRFPRCDDKEGIDTVFPPIFFKEELRAKGQTQEQITAAVNEAYKSGRFRAPRAGSLSYMLSCHPRSVVPAHIMYAVPEATPATLGAPTRDTAMQLAKEGLSVLKLGLETHVVVYDRARCIDKR